MRDALRYEGGRVVVTGAASGIGRACAQLLRDLGAEVHAIDVEPVDGAVHTHRCDLSDPAAIDRAVEEIGGPVDSLFNCAGLPMTAPPHRIMAVNFIGHRHLTEAMLPLMEAGASVGFVSSVAGMDWLDQLDQVIGLLDIPDFEAATEWCRQHDRLVARDGYGLSKVAINAYVARRGFELASRGIRMNATMPGPTETPMLDAFADVLGRDFFATFPKPLGRTSSPEEQAWSLVMLNSPRSGYVAGATLLTDGGYAAGIRTGGIDLAAILEGGSGGSA